MRALGLSLLLTAVLGVGCAGDPPVDIDPNLTCSGKCDGAEEGTPLFDIDFERVNAQWPDDVPATTAQELFSVRVVAGPMTIPAGTHLFGPVNVIPYADGTDESDADGNMVAYGDDIISAYFPPGEIGIAVKHHRPEFRTLDIMASAGGEGFKENFKLQDTHIEIPVGVEIDGVNRVVTLNNPQDYQDGRFGDPDYPMIFLRPVYPDYLSEEQKTAFRDNIRTMVLAFNAVSDFPGDYNGGDPLAANDPEEIRNHAAQMVRAIAGDTAAQAWFEDPANLIYCAELAFVAFSAGMITPLNDATFVPIVGQETWDAFKAALEAHNAGEDSTFTTLNRNPLVAHVRGTVAPDDLRPAAEYAPSESLDYIRVAVQPMTMADIVENFFRTHLPRQQLGEGLAPLQGMVLEGMRPGLLEAMAMDMVPATDPRRVAVDGLFDQLVATVSMEHGSYEEFRTALAPLMDAARMITGPRDDTGTGLFVPPSAFHLTAQGNNPGGLIEFQYVAHGLHYNFVRRRTEAPPEPEPEPMPEGNVLLMEAGMLGRGEENRFEFMVPAGAQRVAVYMTTTEGDPDLYVRKGEAPDTNSYDCRPYSGANTDEECTESPADTERPYHVMVRGYSGAAYTLEARWE